LIANDFEPMQRSAAHWPCEPETPCFKSDAFSLNPGRGVIALGSPVGGSTYSLGASLPVRFATAGVVGNVFVQVQRIGDDQVRQPLRRQPRCQGPIRLRSPVV
jgi:hypothetical protein